jgi:hypothetical protein
MTVKMSGMWRQYKIAMNAKTINARLRKEVAIATLLNAKIYQKAIRKNLGGRPGNAPLTVAIKRSSRPLVDYADLSKSVVGRRVKWNVGVAGVNRYKSRSGGGLNVAELLHEGGSIKVTSAMRSMFKLLSFVAQGKMSPTKLTGRAAELYARGKSVQWRPINTGTIRIPARPFLKNAMRDKKNYAMARRNWKEAVRRAMTGRGR